MPLDIQQYIDLVNSLDLGDKDKKALIKGYKQSQKVANRLDFQLKRTLNDRNIAINLLNQTIEDLQSKQNEVAQANQQLIQQKEQIEEKNYELTEQKQLVEEQSEILQDHLEKLEASYHELEQFSYIASHDLKSPLRSIAGFAQLLKRRYGGQLGEDADEYINFIVTSTVHMGNVIRDLLEYSKTGKNDLLYEEVNLNEVITTVLSNLSSELQVNEVQLEIDHLPTLDVYRTGISQIFQNLMGNAVKFRSEHQPKLIVKCEHKKPYWHFSVADNGIGLDETYKDKVFLPFQRVDGSKIKGTGIGLAICKKIVLMHRGEIWYESKVNEGTTFHFTIFQEDFEENLKKDITEVNQLKPMGG